MHNRLACLDALRGIAAVMVLVQHILERIAPHSALLTTCNVGRLGVLLFFLVSGFVVPFSIGGDRPLRRFAISRLARLLPALWLSVAATLWLIRDADLATVAANMTMLALPLGYDLLSGAYWTLSYELGFYILAAGLYAAGMLRTARVIGALVLASLALALAGHIPLLYGAYLLMGLLLRLALLEGDASARGWATACAVALTLAGGFVGWMQVSGNPLLDGLPRMVACVLALPIFTGLLVWRPQPPRALLFLGTISYSFYLAQTTVLDLLVPVQQHSALVYTVSVFSLTFAVSVLSYRLVEQPFIALGKRWAGSSRARPAPGQQVAGGTWQSAAQGGQVQGLK